MTAKKTVMPYIVIIALFFLTVGVTATLAEENKDDPAVGCNDSSYSFYNEHSFGEDQPPIIGASKTDSDCRRIYGYLYEACGNTCYHTGYAECMNSRISLVCSNGMKGCPNNQPTSCYKYPCQCINGKVSCN